MYPLPEGYATTRNASRTSLKNSLHQPPPADLQQIGQVSAAARRQFDPQARLALGKLHLPGPPNQRHVADRAAARGQRFHQRLAVGPAHAEDVKRLALGGETEFLARHGHPLRRTVGGRLSRAGWSRTRLRRRGGGHRTFAGLLPRIARVDTFAVRAQPAADLRQDLLLFVRYRAVGLRRKIEQQVAALAHGVDRFIYNRHRRTVADVVDVAPTVGGNLIVDLPRYPENILRPADRLLEIQHAARQVGRGLGRDASFFFPLRRAIVVVGRALQLHRVVLAGIYTVVEPQHLRLVFIDQFLASRQPVVLKRGRSVAVVHIPGDRRTVKIGVLRVELVALHAFGGIHERVVFHAMAGDAEDESFVLHRLGQVADQVALRPHLAGAPLGQVAVPHGEAVVMLGHRNHVLRTGAFA